MSSDETGFIDKNTVNSLAKGFRVLQAFTPDRSAMSLAEVGRAAGIDNATAFRFVNTLVKIGYVERILGEKRFRLTLKCLDLGFNAIARTDLRSLARPMLRNLVGQNIEAASLAIPDGSSIVYIERVQAGLARLGVDVRIGSRAPAYSTAIGQSILAYLPRESQIAALESVPRQQLTAMTLTSLDALLDRLVLVRQRGYALSDQENVAGLRVLAAPLLDADGVPVAAISVAAPVFVASLEAFETAAKQSVIDAAKKLSHALQASGGVTAPTLKRNSQIDRKHQ